MNVSVVIPLYNKARHIRRAIDSVFAQTHQESELVVVDDGSTDGSSDVVRHIADQRLRLITQANQGVSAARNRGVREARSGLIAFLDADDEWMPTFLETVLGLHDRYPEAGMYATAYQFCGGNRRWSPRFAHCVSNLNGGLLDDYFLAALGAAPVTSSSVMIPRIVLNEAGLFPVGLSQGEDLQTWARIALRYRVAWSSVVGAVYHVVADNRACNLYWEGPDIGVAPVIEEFLKSKNESMSSRVFIEEYLACGRLECASACIVQGRLALAMELLGKTNNTRMFRTRRLLLQCLVRMPPPSFRGFLKAKALIRRISASVFSEH